VLDIHECGHDQTGNKYKVIKELEAHAVEIKNEQKTKPRDQFYRKIPQGYFLCAEPAFTTQEEITDQRDIIEPVDRVFTMRAERAGFYYRLFKRHPMDTDVKETADDRTE
jgi:hypothetical protein